MWKKLWEFIKKIFKKIFAFMDRPVEEPLEEESKDYRVLTKTDVEALADLTLYELQEENSNIPDIDIPCEGPDCIFESTIEYAGIPKEYTDENGVVHTLYGLPATTLIDGESKIVSFQVFAECRTITERDEQGRPKSGSFKYRLNYDPNNDFIHKFSTADMGWTCNECDKWFNVLGDNKGCPYCDSLDLKLDWIEEWVDKNPNYEFYKTLIVE